MNADLHPDIVGQIERFGDTFKISVQGSDHERRKRFTAAHELGHFLYHRDLLGDGVDDDKAYRSKNVGRFYNRNINSWHETEANRFAASLLMPAHLIERYYTKLNGSVASMAREFDVSKQAMEIRLTGMGLKTHA